MIQFIHTSHASFIMTDQELLKKYFSVQSFLYPLVELERNVYSHIRKQLSLFFFLIKNIQKTDAYYIWFADYHSLLPVLFSKFLKIKSLLILGGYDVTHIPELKYGSFANPVRAFFTRFSIKHADFILPVHQSLAEEAKIRVKNIRGRNIYLPTGYSAEQWFCDSPKRKIILTVAVIKSLQIFKLKGIDLFIDVASHLLKFDFYIVGISSEVIHQIRLTSNVKTFDKVPQHKLREIYSSAKVYTQFSVHEGLPNALCEAMLCECIPVGTVVNGIPDAIGECGFLLYERNVRQAVKLIETALLEDEQMGKKARQRLIAEFPPGRREHTLLGLLKP